MFINVELYELFCGDLGTIIDCNYGTKIMCVFCNDYTPVFLGIKRVSPEELYNLIKDNRYIIKLKKIIMKKPKFETAGIGECLFNAVSSGKITAEEYKTAIKGLNIIRKVL